MERPVFYSQGRTLNEPSFLWYDGAKVDQGTGEAKRLYREVSSVRSWIQLDHSGPVELLCALDSDALITLGIQVKTKTIDGVGRRLLVEGVWVEQRVPSPECGAAFLGAAREAVLESGREIDTDALDTALGELRSRWPDIEWPGKHDVWGFLKRKWRGVTQAFRSDIEQ
jgi:hypothetical protein